MTAPTDAGGRAGRLAALVAERELEMLFVTNLVNVRYLTGFGGTNGACLVGPEVRAFFTDFRYVERAKREVGGGWERPRAEQDLLPEIVKAMRGRIGYEDGHMSARSLRKLEEAAGEGIELAAAGDLVEMLRRSKDAGELERIEAAAKLADEVYRWSLERGLAGRSELDVARSAVARIRELGAEPSFPPIVATAENGALPHAEPGERKIGAGELVVFDMGAELEGYCSDCTRTYAVGEPGADEREAYELVRAAQAAALDEVRAGVGGREVDAVPRKLIDEAGHGERFGHGTGHGVGMEVHEAPRLSPRSEEVLAENDVVTVEPGVYLPGRFGVRIEDLVVVTADGHRNLSALPKELTVVD